MSGGILITVLIRVRSHRARNKMIARLGYLPQGYFSYRFPGEFREVPRAELDKLTGIKGLTRAKVDRDKLCRYRPHD